MKSEKFAAAWDRVGNLWVLRPVMAVLPFCLFTLLPVSAQVRVVVENPTQRVRQQVVEVDAAQIRQQLAAHEGDAFVVRNDFGQEVDYQLTYDGRLLLDVSVRPQGVAAFTVDRGTPRKPHYYVGGRQYPERKDDMAWENDRCAYRLYGPALQRTGERSFGIDVWTKSTPELVLEQRYAADCAGNATEDSLRRIGQHALARDVDMATSFHLDHGNGMDAYAVGATLGCGAPALMKDGQLLMPWCYLSYRILDNGPLRFTVELDYGNEHRRLSLDKGSNFNRMTVWYDSLQGASALAAGVVLHGGQPVKDQDYVLYADPTDNPQQHNSQIFVGALFPEGISETALLTAPDKKSRHAVGIRHHYDGQPYTYYFGAAWSRYDVRSIDEWQLRAQQQLADLREPLTVRVQEPLIALIDRVNTYWQSHHAPEVRSFWDHAAYHTGNIEAYRLTGYERYRQYSERWAEHNKWQGATETDPAKWKYKQYGEGQDYVLFGDWQICFQTYIDLYLMSNEQVVMSDYKIKRALEVMGYEADSKATDYWWWADALYMVMPVMTKMYRLTGDEKYLEKLYRNICYSDSIMLDSETGLYYRDGRYVYPKHKTQAGCKDFWARGDGWVLAGLAKVLQDLPKKHKYRKFFERKYQRLAKAVACLQQPDGYWTRSMMDPEQAPGPETSGTAFFCYGMLWGVNNGLLPRKEFAPVIDRAWNYLTTVALQPDGSVGYVQPIGDRAVPGQVVNTRSQANFGVGAFLLAACEYYRYAQ